MYGHHDVQPVDPLSEWVSPPFEPEVRDGRLWGRGVVDDKGQVYVHVKAIESFIATAGRLPINVKVIVEGEEEIGSAHLETLLRARAADLSADFVCVSDTAMFGRGIPSLCVGLRGLAYLEVFVDGPSRGPALRLVRRRHPEPAARAREDDRGACTTTAGRVTVPGFYDDVLALTAEQRAQIASLPFDEEEWLRSTGAPASWGEQGYSTLERVWARPTLDCCGIRGGFQGEGAKTIIPARASAKLSCRLVPDQEPDDIARKLTEHLQRARAARRARAASRHSTAAGPTWRPPITPSTRSRSGPSAGPSARRRYSCAKAGASPSSGPSPMRRASPAC